MWVAASGGQGEGLPNVERERGGRRRASAALVEDDDRVLARRDVRDRERQGEHAAASPILSETKQRRAIHRGRRPDLREGPSERKSESGQEVGVRAQVRRPDQPFDQPFCPWGGLDSNQRPTDYESANREGADLEEFLNLLVRSIT
jgi:hypothetical protein